jgi:hypothetical protein
MQLEPMLHRAALRPLLVTLPFDPGRFATPRSTGPLKAILGLPYSEPSDLESTRPTGSGDL